MTKVYYFSVGGQCMRVAQRLGQALGADAQRIRRDDKECCETAVVVFPVYCQSVPTPVKQFIVNLTSENVAIVALYGRKNHGNALWEAARAAKGRVIAAAYLPTGHTYLGEREETDFPQFDRFVERINNPRHISMPKERKSFWACVFPRWRSRVGVKIKANNGCNNCGECDSVCPVGAVSCGKINNKCIRCLACVEACKKNALQVSYNPFLTMYLQKAEHNDFHIYL